MKKDKTFFISCIVITIILTFFAGSYFGYNRRPYVERVASVINKTPPTDTGASQEDFEPFWQVWDILNKKYPDADKVTNKERIYGAIKGLAASYGDPYTVFFDPEENKSFNETISGEFSGVGMEVDIKDSILTVISPLKGSPSEKAGMQSGDQILKIDDKVTSGLSVDEAVKLIRGEKGTTVKLTVVRKGLTSPKEISIVRDTIEAPVIDTKKRDDGVFVISLYSFSANSPKLFRNALKEFADSGSSKLIIDLRGNPGGYLDAAIDMASWFLPSGDVVVSEDFGKNGDTIVHRSKGYDVFTNQLKLVILVDGGSASASEILAGALKDNDKATLVGDTTYGKGSVQEVVNVTDDTSLKVTIAKWLTPKGVSISEKGIEPDIKVPFTEDDAKNKKDPQMDKAVEFLNK